MKRVRSYSRVPKQALTILDKLIEAGRLERVIARSRAITQSFYSATA